MASSSLANSISDKHGFSETGNKVATKRAEKKFNKQASAHKKKTTGSKYVLRLFSSMIIDA